MVPSLRFLHQNHVRTSPFPCRCYMPRPALFPWLICGEEWRLWSSPPCSLLHFPYYLVSLKIYHPCHNHYTSAPYWFIHLPPTLYNLSNYQRLSGIQTLFTPNVLLQSFCLYLYRCAECGSTKCLYSYVQVARGVTRRDTASVWLWHAASSI